MKLKISPTKHKMFYFIQVQFQMKRTVIIFDGMAIVNSISIENSKFIKTCEYFANVFTNQIIDESQ